MGAGMFFLPRSSTRPWRAALAGLCLLCAPAGAQSVIDIMDRGFFACELPGNALGAVGIRQPDEDFTIERASRYSTKEGSGTYLRSGERLLMTSGPRNGTAYRVVNRGFVRKLDSSGEPTTLRCVRGPSQRQTARP